MNEPTMVYGPVYAIVEGKRVIVAEKQPLYMAKPCTLSGPDLIAWANRREQEQKRKRAA